VRPPQIRECTRSRPAIGFPARLRYTGEGASAEVHAVRMRSLLQKVFAGLVLCFAASAQAHSPHYVLCPKAGQGGVKLDGDISSWDAGRFVRVDHTHASFGQAQSDADASFRFAVCWDDTHLYVAMEVTDNSIVPAPTLARLYEGDCVEICIDANNDSEGGYGPGDFQFVICPTGPTRHPRVNLYRNPTYAIDDQAFVQRASKITVEGYVIEAAFSWQALGITPKAGQVVGFQIALRDYDADGTKRGLTWAPAADPAANPLRWGDLILVERATDDAKPILDALAQKNARWQRLIDGTARETDNKVEVDVRWVTAGQLGLGLGWNVEFRDGRFPTWDDAAWSSFLDHLAWTRPGWIRYGVNLGHWEPKNDDNDPSHINWEGFAFQSKAMRNHYRVLDVCQKEGIDVLWANWCVGDRATGSNWLAETIHNPALKDIDNDPFTDAPYDPEELAESLTASLYYLRTVKNYTCVKQVSLWNEPSDAGQYCSPSAIYPDTFWTYYTALARHLRGLGIRDAVKIVGPETSTASYESLGKLPSYLRRFSAEVDILAHHDYLGYADDQGIDKGEPLSHAAEAYAKLAWAPRRPMRPVRPIAVTECGNMGNGGAEVGGDEAVWAGTLSVCRLIVEGLNAGVAGFLRWEFKPYGASWQNFGALTTLSQSYLFEPYRPVFFPHALLCRAAVRGSIVLQTVRRGGLDENQVPRVGCAVLWARNAGTAILLVNSGFQPKRVAFAFDPKMPGYAALRFGHLSYDASLPETLAAQPDVAAANGRMELTLPPRSVHALATRADFAKLPPLPALPPRDEPRYTFSKLGDREVQTAHLRFDADYDWHVWQSAAGRTTLQSDLERGKEDNHVCRVAYDFVGVPKGDRTEHVVAHTDLLIGGKPIRVAYRVNGDGQGHRLAFLFVDDKGEIFQHPTSTRIDWTGWQQVQKEITIPLEEWDHWSGDGKVDYPLRGFGFILTAADPTYKGRGILEIDDVAITAEKQ